MKVCESESRSARSSENTGHKEAGHMTQERRDRGQWLRGDISKKGSPRTSRRGQLQGKAFPFRETGRRERDPDGTRASPRGVIGVPVALGMAALPTALPELSTRARPQPSQPELGSPLHTEPRHTHHHATLSPDTLTSPAPPQVLPIPDFLLLFLPGLEQLRKSPVVPGANARLTWGGLTWGGRGSWPASRGVLSSLSANLRAMPGGPTPEALLAPFFPPLAIPSNKLPLQPKPPH